MNDGDRARTRDEAGGTDEDWWTPIDREILDCLARCGAMSPEELGRTICISEGEATAFLTMLAHEGRVRIRQVELNSLGPRDAMPVRADPARP